MKNKKSFDCVEFQRNEREDALNEADYDIRKLIEQVNIRAKSNELNIFLEEKLKKQLKSA